MINRILSTNKAFFTFSYAILCCGLFVVMANAQSTTSLPTTSSTTDIPGGPVNVNVNSLGKNAAGVPIVNPEQVVTDADLQVLQDNYQIVNPNIDRISTWLNSDGTIEITIIYKHPGDFLGILPSSFKTITTVSSNPNNIPTIDSKLSFWSSLISNKKFDKEKVIARLSNNETIRNEMQLNMDPTTTAKIIKAIVFELDQNELESVNL